MIRLIIIFIFLILFLIVTLPVIFVLWLIGRHDPALRTHTMQHLAQWALGVIGKLAGCRVTVIGHDRIPDNEAVLYIGNHRSFFDTILTYPLCPGLLSYMGKKEIGNIPILRLWLRALHCPLIDRSNIKEGVKGILNCIALVRSGTSLFIFPEGTRNKTDGPILPFKAGAFKIAEKTGCAVIPTAIVNTGQIFEDHFPTVHASHVIIEFGSPIYIDQLPQDDKKNIDEYFRHILQSMVDNNRQLI